MKSTNDLKNKTILVIGYARTGKSVVHFLLKAGANVILNDRGDLSQDPSVSLLIHQGVRVVDGGHPLSLLDGSVEFIVKNPGIPYHLEIFQEAIRKNIPIITDVELVSKYATCPIIGITGSNGKTTTTALIYDILKYGYKNNVHLAGNIGIPSLDVLKETKSEDVLVMELSSFQLEGTIDFHPHIAVVTNLYEAHLDYHGTRENYIHAKLKLLRHLTETDYLIYNYSQNELHAYALHSKAHKLPFTSGTPDLFIKENGIYVMGNMIHYKDRALFDLKHYHLPGQHNLENLLAALAVAVTFDLPIEEIIEAVDQFRGLPHRLQYIGEANQIRYFNDSKSTNITATITALKSFDQPIIYIGGGLDRGNEFDELIPYLKNVKAAVLYGESKDKMEKSFEQADISSISLCHNLEEAAEKAFHLASPGDIVLFSPSCASWDQFKNYEERGNQFIQSVSELLNKEGGVE